MDENPLKQGGKIMSNPIKVGIVGLGRAGWSTHISTFEKMADKYQVAAVCDIEAERVEAAVERCKCKGYASIEELIKDPDVELVDIATRSCDHYPHAMLALKAGKNVVLEKPISLNYEEAKELIAYAEREDTPTLFFRQNRRVENFFVKVREIIDSGILGTVSEIDIAQRSYQRRDDWQTLDEFGGGLLLNWGPHIVDHAVILLGDEIEEQFSTMQHSTAGGDREDHISMHLVGKNGRKVNMWISGSCCINTGRTITVYGNRGAMEAKGQEVYIKYIDPKQELPNVVANPGNPPSKWGKSGTFEIKVEPRWIEERHILPNQDLYDMWYDLYESFRNDKEYPIKSEEVLRMMKALSKVHEGKVWDLTANRDKL